MQWVPIYFELECNEIFTCDQTQKLIDFAYEKQTRRSFSSIEPSIIFHSLANIDDSEEITLERFKTPVLSSEINTITDWRQTSNIRDSSQTSVSQIHQNDPNNETKPHFKKYHTFVLKQSLRFYMFPNTQFFQRITSTT